ncbi:MAG: hypothetical protein AB7O62_20200, partial [Pirellulales bacterium]
PGMLGAMSRVCPSPPPIGASFMNNTKPVPLSTEPQRKKCPVCGKPSYSASGIHPQCCSTRSDAVLKAARKAAAVVEEG